MHFSPHFNTIQTLWTLTFAALLVLMVVLLGKDRARRFPVFSISIALMAFRLLATRLLFGRLSPVVGNVAFIGLAMLTGLVNLGLVLELGWKGFRQAPRRTWLLGAGITGAIALAMVILWGPWPGWQVLTGTGILIALHGMQIVAQRSDMLADGLAVQLAILILVFGRRFGAGWRTLTQRLLVGFAVGGGSQLAIRGIWQYIATHSTPHSQEQYFQLLGLQEKLYNANSIAYIVVLIWWIAVIWIDEPAAGAALPAPVTLEEVVLDASARLGSQPAAETIPETGSDHLAKP